jgi:hypothetical protein
MFSILVVGPEHAELIVWKDNKLSGYILDSELGELKGKELKLEIASSKLGKWFAVVKDAKEKDPVKNILAIDFDTGDQY